MNDDNLGYITVAQVNAIRGVAKPLNIRVRWLADGTLWLKSHTGRVVTAQGARSGEAILRRLNEFGEL